MARVLPVLLLLAALALPATAAAAPDNADVSVTLADSPDPVDAGATLTYSLTVANSIGSGRTAAAVTLTDTLPAGTTFVSMTQTSGPEFGLSTPAFGGTGTVTASGGALAPGAVARFTLVVRVDTSTADGTTISNSPHVGSTTADPTMANNDATESTAVTVHADLDVSKVAVATSGNDVTYQIEVINKGPSPAQAVTLSDPLPGEATFTSATAPVGWTLTTPAVGNGGTVFATKGSMAAGESGTFTLVLTAAAGLPDPTLIQNTASVSSSTPDANSANNASTGVAGVGTKADLAVTASGTPATALPGSNVTYTVTLANNGVDAKDVVLRDTLPGSLQFVSATQTGGQQGFSLVAPAVGASGSVTFSVGSLVAGGSATFQVVAAVAPGTAAGTSVDNPFAATTTTSQANTANDAATVTTAVGAAQSPPPPPAAKKVDLRTTASAKPAGAKPRGKVTLTFRVTNKGDRTATKARLAGALPSGLKRVRVSSSAGSCANGARVSCGLGNLPTGASATVTVKVKVKRKGGLRVSAAASSAQKDAKPGNNAAAVTVKRR